MPRHPLKLVEIGRIKWFSEPTLKSPACKECLSAYQSNANMAVALSQAPSFSALAAVSWASACTSAMTDLNLGNGAEVEALPLEKFHQYFRLAEEKMKSYMQDVAADETQLEQASLNLEQIVSRSGMFTHTVFEKLLKSIVVQGWTALEILIEDLHTKVIEEHPKVFAQAVVSKHARGKIDHRGVFGFRSPRAFIAAYEEAFDLDSIIKKRVQHRDLLSLLFLRNAVVHKGGVADRKFMTLDLVECKSLGIFSPKLGADLVFDGERVRNIVDPAFRMGYKLIKQVDRWLIAKGI